MKIGNVDFGNNPIILAPMAGVTDVGFRAVCSEFGATATVTEMISAKGLKYDSEKTKELLETTTAEKIKIVQIFGHEPSVMAEIVKHPLLQKFDIIDINCGCPAPKIVNNGDGSALMKNIELAEKIISECVKNSSKPITVKFRSGWNDNSVNAVEFAKMCERAGASAITIHGRTREQQYAGNVDYDVIKQVKESVKIPVFGNGDVFDKASYEKMIETGVDGVFVARGALGNPQIFSELKGVPAELSIETIKKHYEIYSASVGETRAMLNMRKHFAWYLKGVKNVADFRLKVLKLETFAEVEQVFEQALKNK